MKTQQNIQKTLAEVTRRLRCIEDRLNDKHEVKINWLDSTDVCQRLHISKRTLAHFRESGKLPSSKLGMKVYYRVADIEYCLAANLQQKGMKS